MAVVTGPDKALTLKLYSRPGWPAGLQLGVDQCLGRGQDLRQALGFCLEDQEFPDSVNNPHSPRSFTARTGTTATGSISRSPDGGLCRTDPGHRPGDARQDEDGGAARCLRGRRARGCDNTIGNTGNIVLPLAQGRKPLRARWCRTWSTASGSGRLSEVFVCTPGQMAEVVAANPFPAVAAERPAEMAVCTFHKPPDWAPVATGYVGPEQIAVAGEHLVVATPGHQHVEAEYREVAGREDDHAQLARFRQSRGQGRGARQG